MLNMRIFGLWRAFKNFIKKHSFPHKSQPQEKAKIKNKKPTHIVRYKSDRSFKPKNIIENIFFSRQEADKMNHDLLVKIKST